MNENHHTPIDVHKIEETSTHPHIQTLEHKSFFPHIDKNNWIFLGSVVFFASSLAFWTYVNFFMK